MLYTNLARTHHTIPRLEQTRAELKQQLQHELETLRSLSVHAAELGLHVAAGHGLNYHNVTPIIEIETIEELNIGQSIIARSVFDGLESAVREMKRLVSEK